MPTPKKPADRRQRSNSNDVGKVLALVPGSASVPAVPNDGWLDSTVEQWQAFWLTPMAGPAVLKPSDRPALVRLFELSDRLARALRSFDDDPMSYGSTGQVTLSPWAAEVHRLEAAIGRLEDRFGLTPIARLKLGVTFEEGVNLAQRNAALLEQYRRAEGS